MKLIIKQPSDCTSEELVSFVQKVLEGEQVNPNTLSNQVKNAKYLGYCYIDKTLVGVSAIKHPANSYILKILKKAELDECYKAAYELGYSYTSINHRGKGINKLLNDNLLIKTKNLKENIFATTARVGMTKYLLSRGFINIGQSYEGSFNQTLKFYFTSCSEITIPK